MHKTKDSSLNIIFKEFLLLDNLNISIVPINNLSKWKITLKANKDGEDFHYIYFSLEINIEIEKIQEIYRAKTAIATTKIKQMHKDEIILLLQKHSVFSQIYQYIEECSKIETNYEAITDIVISNSAIILNKRFGL